jgi:pimeloyl-ACP methyl ester carboxylesterase
MVHDERIGFSCFRAAAIGSGHMPFIEEPDVFRQVLEELLAGR